jgi:tRNASer (uridine44-2'-O)-methyltransferase
VNNEKDMPWYHPPLKSLAYLYQEQDTKFTLSIHFLPFQESDGPLPSRLHRTLISLLQTFLRLAKSPAPPSSLNDQQDTRIPLPASNASMAPSALKDTILPQHIVQDTYTRLKQQYASDLMARWAEQTEPSKHVFEDISIAAFIIELWKQMYTLDTFPGFVDVACGNGVLSYILINEGYHGRGFDARRRKTWDVLGMADYLDEMICVPKPFVDASDAPVARLLPDTAVHDGIFKPGTFIISNHADELTPWTPLLAALSSTYSPLPFLAIPCCSHALSGAKHRYSPNEARSAENKLKSTEDQSVSGDLKALRAAKAKAANHGDDKSMYACLTRKVAAISEELGFEVELTLMRIPSTRNIGIVGNRRKASTRTISRLESRFQTMVVDEDQITNIVGDIVDRECTKSGGAQEAARTWIERAQKLQAGQGRGKVNLGRKPNQNGK